jgi:Icc-related predicted phosphoesterase
MITSIAFLAIIFIVSTVIPFQGHVNNDVTEALKKEIETLNCRISTMITDGNTDRADIISKQQILIKALNDNKVLENKLNEVRLSIDGINKRIANNPNQISNDLKKCLLELQENINK